MSDVFISYSRIDSAFVRQLQQQLAARGREAWVDWRDIPPTAEWLQEIYAGIEAANAVVFVLSPEFLASETCRLEVAHAKECKKRLIPVVRRDIGLAQVDDALSKLNWIFFREHDDADTSFETLLTALDTDLAYDRESTRLLVRAVEWKGRGQADAVTLRGAELEDAERWLAQGASKVPSPSPLQVDYITASRKAVGRRQRRLLTGVSAALVVTLILSIVSFALFQLAQAREQTAQANYAQALARLLAAQSLSHAGIEDRDVAMLLAVEAFRRDPHSGEAANAVLTALEAQPELAGFVQDYTDTWTSVAFSSDGKMLAAGSMKGTITFWDVATHRQIGGSIVADPRNHSPLKIAFSPDDRLVVSVGATTTLQAWNVTSHQLVAQSPPLAPAVSFGGITFSPDGKQVAVNACIAPSASETSHEAITVWSLTGSSGTLMPIYSLDACEGHQGIAYTPNGQYIAAGAYRATVLLDVSTHRVVHSLPSIENYTYPYNPILALAFSPNSTVLAVGECQNPVPPAVAKSICIGGAIQLWSVETGRLITTLIGHSTSVTGLAFRRDGNMLASAGGDNTVILWGLGLEKDVMLSRFDAHGSVGTNTSSTTHTIAFSPHGGTLVSASASDLNLSLWNTDVPQPLATPLPAFPDEQITSHDGEEGDGAISPNGQRLAVSDCLQNSSGFYYGSRIWLWNLSTRRQITERHLDDPGSCPAHLVFSRDSQQLAFVFNKLQPGTPYHDGYGVELWQVGTNQRQTLSMPAADALDQRIHALTFDPKGSLVAAGGCHLTPQIEDVGEIVLWSGTSHRPSRLEGSWNGGCVEAMSFSPDGNVLAVGVCLDQPDLCHKPEVQLWSMQSRQQIGQLNVSANFGDFTDLWYSPDGKTVAARGWTDPGAGGAAFWDVSTGKQIQSFPAPVTGMAITDNWSFMATFGCRTSATPDLVDDGCGIQLRNIPEDHTVGVPLQSGRDIALSAPLFGPSNDMFVTFSPGVPPALWDMNPASWAARICRNVGRNLTRTEWNRYLTPQEPYRQTCPALPAAPGT